MRLARIPGPRAAIARMRSGFTLIELLVSLALSALLLRMVLPMLSAANRGYAVADLCRSDAPPAWRLVLQEDLAALVAQSKCGVPVVLIHPASAAQAFDRLELQTLCRAGEMSRGPLKAMYVLETSGEGGGLSLVRYGSGWHDSVKTRHVLLRGVDAWSLGGALAAPVPSTQPAAGPSTIPPRDGATLLVSIQRNNATATWQFVIPAGAAIEARP